MSKSNSKIEKIQTLPQETATEGTLHSTDTTEILAESNPIENVIIPTETVIIPAENVIIPTEIATEKIETTTIIEEEKDMKNTTEETNIDKQIYGNQDTQKKYLFDVSLKNFVVIRSSLVTKIGDSEADVAEVPSSVRIQPFEAYMFDKLVKDKAFEGKRIIILHDPRIK